MDLLFFLVVCLAASYAWNDTEIGTVFRNFVAKIRYIRKPMLCHECSSFWISLFVSIFFNPLNNVMPIVSNIILAFAGFFVNLYFVRNKLIPHNYD